MSQAKRLLEERAQKRRVSDVYGGVERGRPVIGDIRQLTERDPLAGLPTIDVDTLVKEYHEKLMEGVTEAFERVLSEFCNELLEQSDAWPYEMMFRNQLRRVIRDTQKKIPAIVKKALNEDD